MTLDPSLRRTAVRIHLLNAQGEAFANWHESELDALPLPVQDYWRACDALDEAQTEELDAILGVLPSASEFARMGELAASLTRGELGRLRAEDRLWMAEVRCFISDALDHAQHGDFVEALDSAKRGFDRLDWMINGRSRRDPRRNLANADVMPLLFEAHRAVAVMVDEFTGLTQLVMR